MAHKYVWSGAAGAGTGADWTNAYTTLPAAAGAAGTAAGDNIWVAHDHAEAQASAMTINFKNTYVAPGTVIAVNRAGSVPPVAADIVATPTAMITTTGAFSMTLGGSVEGVTWIEGITFSAGSGAVSNGFFTSTTVGFIFNNCLIIKAGTTQSGSAINFNAIRFNILYNTKVQFGATGGVNDSISMAIGTRFEWYNTVGAIAGSNIPTLLFSANYVGNPIVMRGVDLSGLGSNTIFNSSSATTGTPIATLENCKLGASAILASTPATPKSRITMINCDSAASNYRTAAIDYMGTLTTETTIVRTGGATDGTTPIAWKIVTTANSKWLLPFESLPITVWNDTTGAKTVSIYGYWSNASAPNNDDIWIDVEGLTNASFPNSSLATSNKASFLATNAAIPTDSSAWGGGATTTKFKMSASVTAAMKGPITVRIRAAKASSTFYIDPKIEVV